MKHLRKFNESEVSKMVSHLQKNGAHISPEDINKFQYIEQVKIENDSKYYIVCANINPKDTWVWKFCIKEHNFTPVWSSEYGDCSILGEDLGEAMKLANDWISSNVFESPQYQNYPVKPVLFLMMV